MNYKKVRPRKIYQAVRARLTTFAKLQRTGRVSVGRGSYGTPNVMTFEGDETTRLVIGNYCSIASSSTFLLGGNHPLDRRSTYPIRLRQVQPGAGTDGFPSSKGDILVGHDVWIGHAAIILSGVSIGNGAVIGAGAVVTTDVPAYTVMVGNPAQAVKTRLTPNEIQEVTASAWWDWEVETVVSSVNFLNGPYHS